MKKILLFGDAHGIPQLLSHVPTKQIAAIIGAAIRPQYHAKLALLAEERNIKFLLQPRYGGKEYPAFLESLVELSPDLLLCHSYSMLIREEILRLVDGNAVNIHASLLPRNRGPNPVQWALINGHSETGVTLHYMNNAIDSGDIIAQRSVIISEQDTWLTLLEKINIETLSMLKVELAAVLDGTNSRRPQNEELANHNVRLNADSPRIDFPTMTDRMIFNLIRAQVSPLSGAYIETDSGRRHFTKYMCADAVAQLRAQYG